MNEKFAQLPFKKAIDLIQFYYQSNDLSFIFNFSSISFSYFPFPFHLPFFSPI